MIKLNIKLRYTYPPLTQIYLTLVFNNEKFRKKCFSIEYPNTRSNNFESYKNDENYPNVKISMKYIYRFLKEQKFEYGELPGSKRFFQELETHYVKY